ncbi:hypothetical protein [Streptomyces sp. 8N706]|uniref:hypothetical protein n=1 Tax=Streptomyces sp. 8N706 TaxID=3457416 RepID=UPI003FD06497
MTPIDELLARVRLLDDPVVPADVVPDAPGEDTDTHPLLDAASPGPAPGPGRGWDSETAGDDLTNLCEAVVAHTAATSLRNFDTEHLPAPPGARTLGCILQLAQDEEGARFWWQYAAGAGDDAASYCLYLHHLAHGEIALAIWWQGQTRTGTQPDPEDATLPGAPEPMINLDASTPTMLRVLRHLVGSAERRRTELVSAVMDYVPSAVAVGYLDNPDFEIPLPRADFADHIGIILAVTAVYGDKTGTSRCHPARWPRLPGRPEYPRTRRLPRPKSSRPRNSRHILADFDTLSSGLLLHD